jgi:acyl-CoA hydrolase
MEAYRRKLVSAREAASRVRSSDTLALPVAPGFPAEFVHALGERDDFEALDVLAALLPGPFELFTRRGVRMRSAFYGPVERALAAAGHAVEFVPADFRRITQLIERQRPRVMATLVAPPDAQGRMSLSLYAGSGVDELHRCGADRERVLIAEVSRRAPRTLGLPPEHSHSLGVDEVDLVVETDREPFMLPDSAPSDLEHAIAEHARRFVSEGATLQTGIGGVPSEIAGLLARGAGGDYGIHGEMFTTGLMRLHQAGKVTNRKGSHDGVSICTFALGTRELYDWLDGNERVRFLPVEAVNSAEAIGRNRNAVAINGALAVDLYGQLAADTLAGRQFSGIGGHEDFVSGGSLAPGGRSLVCLPAAAESEGRRLSRIVCTLPAGVVVTTPRHAADVVITEYGAAELAGRTVSERAHALIGIAHPELRDGLRAEWEKLTGGAR